MTPKKEEIFLDKKTIIEIVNYIDNRQEELYVLQTTNISGAECQARQNHIEDLEVIRFKLTGE